MAGPSRVDLKPVVKQVALFWGLNHLKYIPYKTYYAQKGDIILLYSEAYSILKYNTTET